MKNLWWAKDNGNFHKTGVYIPSSVEPGLQGTRGNPKRLQLVNLGHKKGFNLSVRIMNSVRGSGDKRGSWSLFKATFTKVVDK